MSAASRVPKPMLRSGEFVDYFRELHGFDPFPWQTRLAVVIESGQWPETIELPTAAGKTAVIDIAVFALALDAQKPPAERKASRRIFFTIDRRIVVDATELRARLIAQRLSEARGGILAHVAQLLRSLSDSDTPLHVSKLRGGIYRDSSWARSPQQPTICVTTVDQLGSRLLYRGYGLRAQAWPIHAGLIAHDSLIVLDEVHISRPFEQTLATVRRYGMWAEKPLARPLQFVRMSATPKAATERFTLSDDDHSHLVLGPRLTARKLALCEKPAKDRDQMIAAICHEAPKMVSATRRVISIVVNRVTTARTIFEQLRQSNDYDAVLLTGRVRPFDRDHLIAGILPRVRAGRDRSVEQQPLIVIATQCIEVGADFDFDAMITECAPLDALRQRLGRVDRLGELKESPVVIAANNADLKNDLIYGEVTDATWKWLNGKKPKVKTRRVDLGTAAQATFPPEELEALCAGTQDAPILLPAHCDMLAQTSPAPAADPEPALFLHGELELPEVQIVWRADLDPKDPDSWAATGELLPPKREEALAVPISAARPFLLGAPPVDVANVNSLMTDEPVNGKKVDRLALRWRGDESGLIRANALAPGDTIVVPASYGGCDRYGWHPQYSGTVTDIGDAVAAQQHSAR